MTSLPTSPPELPPEPGWVELPLEEWAIAPAFVSGDSSGNRFRVRYFRRAEDGNLVGKAWFGPGTMGPPGHAHGGSIASVLDEAMGAAAWFSGHAVVAARLTVEFRQMVPIETVAVFETWIDEVVGRKITLRSQLSDGGDTIYSEGSGLFIVLKGFEPST